MEDIQNNFEFNELFEKKISHYTGFKYAVTVDCCTNGILLSLVALQIIGLINKNTNNFIIPNNTYMSIPMLLKNNGWKFIFKKIKWKGFYNINNNIFDAATDFHQNMIKDYETYSDPIVCISFQQKKRLSLGRGGAILLNNKKIYQLLKRLRHDGRDSMKSDNEEINYNPNDIICGYHCYMEPDKAAKGLLILNQESLMKPYKKHTWKEYEDLTKLNIWK